MARPAARRYEVLYYPFIEVPDPGWLMSAVLLWDQIVTIAPDTIQPYVSPLSRALADESILVPHRVNSSRREVESVSEMIGEMLGNGYFEAFIGKGHWSVQPSRWSRVHSDKIASNLKFELERLGHATQADGKFLSVSGGLATAYILLLASVIAARKKCALATDQILAYRAMSSYRFSESIPNDDFGDGHRGDTRRNEKKTEEQFLDACLSELTLVWFRLAPDTDIQKVLRFRKKRRPELERMRSSIMEAGASIIDCSEPTYTSLRKAAKDYVNSEIKPALSDLQKVLRDERIDFVTDSLQLALYSEAPGLVGNYFGQPWALLAAPLCSIAVRAVKYLAKRKSTLKNSPWSYLQKARHTLGDS